MTIQQHLDAEELSAAAFAKEVGVDRATMGRWISGECAPDGENIETIIKASKGKITVAGILAPSKKRKRKAAA